MTNQQVADIIEEFHVPLHIRRHCAAVSKFAVELGKKLAAVGEKIDIDLLRHAALLHDFVRVVDFKKFEPEQFLNLASAGERTARARSRSKVGSRGSQPNEAELRNKDIAFWKMLREKYKGFHHAEAGARILEERGFYAIARLVRCHRFLQIAEGFDSWEEKILYYADKRTKHDRVVTLKERLLDGRKRNAPETENTKETAELDLKVFALEREILTKIGEMKQAD